MSAKSVKNKKSGGCGDVLGATVPRGRRPKAQQLLAGMKNILISKASVFFHDASLLFVNWTPLNKITV
jgi:hypothetical protein